MTIRDAEQLARQTLGSRINVDRTDEGWTITQWDLSDSCYKQERVIGQHKQWDAALQQAVGNYRQPWTCVTPIRGV